jgi:hypothetical protein
MLRHTDTRRCGRSSRRRLVILAPVIPSRASVGVLRVLPVRSASASDTVWRELTNASMADEISTRAATYVQGPYGGSIGVIVDHLPHAMPMSLGQGVPKGVSDVPRCETDDHRIDLVMDDGGEQHRQAEQLIPTFGSGDCAINIDTGNRPATVGGKPVRQSLTPFPSSSSACSSFAPHLSPPHHHHHRRCGAWSARGDSS